MILLVKCAIKVWALLLLEQKEDLLLAHLGEGVHILILLMPIALEFRH
jgi:hypothetical protein